ncbi:hypothetical protein LTR36_005240 [Oleoguttula mirabilis]|uniref:Uncharacterized protein n=1 Tax=Oleoguttula mirabilis TaxID=1507867 RepID=A0AAV9JW31_9PEZI|nr:hypothetical protein LTR36_005240 [Oleoguttula mirabilis]
MELTLETKFSMMELVDSAQSTGSSGAIGNAQETQVHELAEADLSAAFTLLQLRRKSNATLRRLHHPHAYRTTLANIPIHPRFFNKLSRSRAAYILQGHDGGAVRRKAATYAAYLASWGPHYFTGMPLGAYEDATVLLKMPGLKKKQTVFGAAVGRPIITNDKLLADFFIFEDTTMDPKKMDNKPNIMLMNIEAPRSKITTVTKPLKLTTTTAPDAAKPAISSSMQAVLDKWKSGCVGSTLSAPIDLTEGTKKRKRVVVPDDDDDEDDEIVVATPAKIVETMKKRKLARAPAPEEVEETMGSDETLARQLQYEMNFGARNRVRHLRRGEVLREL